MRRLSTPGLPALGLHPVGRPLARAAIMLAGLGLALVLRLDVAGGTNAWQGGADYRPIAAGVAFALALLAIAWAARQSVRGTDAVVTLTVSPSNAIALAWGVLGAAVLVAFPLALRLDGSIVGTSFPAGDFPVWAGVVTLVAVAEEALLRGVLFAAIAEALGPGAAVILTAVAFALLHVPLYGPGVLPLDLAVGIWLGTLRVVSGSVVAPAAAHALADIAAWWLA